MLVHIYYMCMIHLRYTADGIRTYKCINVPHRFVFVKSRIHFKHLKKERNKNKKRQESHQM